MAISFVIFPGPLNCTHAGRCVTAPTYRGYLMACDWLQLSNRRLSVVTDMNVGAVVTNNGRRIRIKRQAAALIRAFVNIEPRGKKHGTGNAARACILACASHARDKMPVIVQLGWTSNTSQQKINLPTIQKGCDTFETTVGKLSARRI